MRVKLLSSLVAITLFSIMLGCGGSGSSTTGTTSTGTPTLKSIVVSPGTSTAQVLKTQQFTATGSYSDGSSKDISSTVTWTSSSTTIASISNSGLATLLGGGSTTIQAASGSIKGSTTLMVTDSLVSIGISSSASSVNVASTLQLAALGTYQDGKPASALTGATWSSSDTTKATVTSTGIVTGVKGGAVTITASFGSLSSQSQLSVVAVLTSINVTPVGPAILVGGAQPFTATGMYNDGSTQDFTATANWSVSDLSKGTVSANQVSGVAAGAITVNASANGMIGSTALNIVTSTYATLRGNYTFTLMGDDARGPDFFQGAVVADGNGNISGVEDSNTLAGVQSNVPVSGVYDLYPDGRGTMKINANVCHPSGITLRFILYSAGTMGKLAEFDGAGSTRGKLMQQDASAFNNAALNGSYVFRTSGIDSRNNASTGPQAMGQVGLFVANGTGAISSGVMDTNDYSVFYGTVPLAASTYTIGTNGRGTMQFVTASGTTNYAVYMINATSLNFVQIDASPSSTVAGVAELQTNIRYQASTFDGSFSILLDASVWQGGSATQYSELGEYNLDGLGNMTGLTNEGSISGAYEADGTVVNGRGQMHIFAATDNRIDFFYAVSPTKMYALQSFTLPTIFSSNPATGEMILQSGTPYTAASLMGTYAVDASDVALSSSNLIWMTMNGAGNMAGIEDSAVNGNVSSSVIGNATYGTNSTTAPGYGSMQLTVPAGTSSYTFYLASPKQAWLVAGSPLLDGGLDQQ